MSSAQEPKRCFASAKEERKSDEDQNQIDGRGRHVARDAQPHSHDQPRRAVAWLDAFAGKSGLRRAQDRCEQSSLSVADLAKYQQKALQSKQAANDQAAGASGNKTGWIVVGVAAAVGLIALAAGGGGMGGGY
jgi:hypothetical protein